MQAGTAWLAIRNVQFQAPFLTIRPQEHAHVTSSPNKSGLTPSCGITIEQWPLDARSDGRSSRLPMEKLRNQQALVERAQFKQRLRPLFGNGAGKRRN